MSTAHDLQMPPGDRTLQHTLDQARTIDRVHEHGARDDGDAPM